MADRKGRKDRKSSGSKYMPPRPAKGFTTQKAQKWVLTAAIVDGIVYLVRHLIEGETSPAPSTNAARAFLGQGSPPSFGQWIIAYGASFMALALLAAAAPELAASFAMFVLAATLVESGGQFAKDLGQLDSGGPTIPTPDSSTFTLSPALTSATTNLAGDTFGTAPSPQSVGASVVAKQAATDSADVVSRAEIAKLNAQILGEAKNLPAGYTVKIVNGRAQLLLNGKIVSTG